MRVHSWTPSFCPLHAGRLGRSALDAEFAEKSRLYERNQHFLGAACHAVHDPAALQDAQVETAGCRIRNSKNVPVLRVDHISIEAMLFGVRQVSCTVSRATIVREMTTAHLILARSRIEPIRNMKDEGDFGCWLQRTQSACRGFP